MIRDLVNAEPWMSRGRCRDLDPETFFPRQGGGGVELAKRKCTRCPVALECLRYALPRPELDGVWGATSKQERRRLRERIGMKPARSSSRRREGRCVNGHEQAGQNVYTDDHGRERCRPCNRESRDRTPATTAAAA